MLAIFQKETKFVRLKGKKIIMPMAKGKRAYAKDLPWCVNDWQRVEAIHVGRALSVLNLKGRSMLKTSVFCHIKSELNKKLVILINREWKFSSQNGLIISMPNALTVKSLIVMQNQSYSNELEDPKYLKNSCPL